MPRAGLTPDVVVDTALAIVDDDGPAALTLAAVAGRAGVATPSLYKHVKGLPRLRNLIAVRAIDGLTETITAAVIGHSGPDAVRAILLAYRDYVRAHPHRYAMIPQAPGDDPAVADASKRLLDVLYATLSADGITGTEAVHRIRGIRAVAHGFADLEISGGFQLAEDVDDSYLALIAALTGSP